MSLVGAARQRGTEKTTPSRRKAASADPAVQRAVKRRLKSARPPRNPTSNPPKASRPLDAEERPARKESKVTHQGERNAPASHPDTRFDPILLRSEGTRLLRRVGGGQPSRSSRSDHPRQSVRLTVQFDVRTVHREYDVDADGEVELELRRRVEDPRHSVDWRI